jgi:uncharacterized protein
MCPYGLVDSNRPGYAGPVKHFILFYDVVDDYLERRAPLRAEHLALARNAAARGELRLAGAFADPVDGAALVFRGADREVAERFAVADPYVKNGLVTRWHVREWTVVIGSDVDATG